MPPCCPAPPTPLMGHGREPGPDLPGDWAGHQGRLLTLTSSTGRRQDTAGAEGRAAAWRRSTPLAPALSINRPVEDAAGICPATLALALGLELGQERTGCRRCAHTCGAKRCCLLLDNMEQILGAAAFVSELLAACPGRARDGYQPRTAASAQRATFPGGRHWHLTRQSRLFADPRLPAMQI